MAEDNINLTNQEAWDLVATILEGVDFVEGDPVIRASWAAEMRDWSLMLLDRIIDNGGGAITEEG